MPHLHNSHDVISWNTDKVYLRQLEAAGVPIIETRWDIAPGDDIGEHDEWVVKPTVSAGSRDTARWTSRDDVYAHSAELVAAGRTSMTQPYIASVDDEGETAMLFFGGTFSHAIRKGAILARAKAYVRTATVAVRTRWHASRSEAQHAVAAQALAATDEILGRSAELMYARVDLVTAADGSPLVIELELTEPSLFLPWSDGGADRLVDAIAATL